MTDENRIFIITFLFENNREFLELLLISIAHTIGLFEGIINFLALMPDIVKVFVFSQDTQSRYGCIFRGLDYNV